MENLKDFEKYTNQENALIVENYPYGYKRTQIKYFVETKGNKQRAVSCTLNPVTKKWNALKPSTYSDLVLMYKEKETGYIKFYHYSLTYSDEEDFKKLLEFLGDYRNAYIETFLKLCRAIYETRKHIKITCSIKQFRHKITGEIIDTVPLFDMNNYEEVNPTDEEEQKGIRQDLGRIFIHNAKKEGMTKQEIETAL